MATLNRVRNKKTGRTIMVCVGDWKAQRHGKTEWRFFPPGNAPHTIVASPLTEAQARQILVFAKEAYVNGVETVREGLKRTLGIE